MWISHRQSSCLHLGTCLLELAISYVKGESTSQCQQLQIEDIPHRNVVFSRSRSWLSGQNWLRKVQKIRTFPIERFSQDAPCHFVSSNNPHPRLEKSFSQIRKTNTQSLDVSYKKRKTREKWTSWVVRLNRKNDDGRRDKKADVKPIQMKSLFFKDRIFSQPWQLWIQKFLFSLFWTQNNDKWWHG